MSAHPDSRDTTLRQGLDLLEEQRQAMLEHNADHLSAVNGRLSDWLASFRAGMRAPGPARAPNVADGRLRDLRAALDANAILARRSTLRTARALEALVPATRQNYTADGLASTSLPRRATRSA